MESVFKRFLQLALLSLIAVQLAVFSANLNWFLELFTHYPHYYAIASAILAIMLSLKRMPNAAILATVILAINLGTISPYLDNSQINNQAATPTATQSDSDLKILAVNFYYKNMEFGEVDPMLEETTPDIFIIHEASEYWWPDPKAPFANSHPYQYKTEESGVTGIFMASKKDGTYTEIPLGNKFGLEFQPEGYDLKILAVHPPAPINSSFAEERNLQFEAITTYVQENDTPVIIMGDFNCTPWSPYFQNMLAQSMLQDARLGFGFIPTWHAHNFAFEIPIDHALVSPEINVTGFETASEIASDHRPILLEINF